MLILRWGYFPNEVRQALQPILSRYLWLVLGWCRELTLRYQMVPDDGDEAVEMQACINREYRQAEITLCGRWIDLNPTRRRSDIIHELLHIPLDPMVDEHRTTLRNLFQDDDAPKFKASLDEHWRQAFEGTTQDLAFAILAIPMEALPIIQVMEEEDEHPPLRAAS